jgi:hypothetical protein
VNKKITIAFAKLDIIDKTSFKNKYIIVLINGTIYKKYTKINPMKGYS